MRFKSMMFGCFLAVFVFLFNLADGRANPASSETIKLRADLQVVKCTFPSGGTGGLPCLIMVRLQNVEIVLTKQDTSPSEGYEQWQGSWQDAKSEEGIDFAASLLVTRHRYHGEDGSSDSYNLEARVGTTDTEAQTSISVASIDELNSLTLMGESLSVYGCSGRSVLTPHFHLGPPFPEQIPLPEPLIKE